MLETNRIHSTALVSWSFVGIPTSHTLELRLFIRKMLEFFLMSLSLKL